MHTITKSKKGNSANKSKIAKKKRTLTKIVLIGHPLKGLHSSVAEMQRPSSQFTSTMQANQNLSLQRKKERNVTRTRSWRALIIETNATSISTSFREWSLATRKRITLGGSSGTLSVPASKDLASCSKALCGRRNTRTILAAVGL
jgi:hypothetical protein